MPLSDSDSQPPASAQEIKKESKWHRRLVQQRLRGWSPILHARVTELYFLAVGAFCLALGIPILVASLNIVQYTARYDAIGPFVGLDVQAQQQLLWDAGSLGVPLSVNIPITDKMEAPIYVVYEITSMFQNYRRYVRSYDSVAMHDGLDVNETGASACSPFRYITGEADDSLPNQGAIQPCGQISQSLFNDTFAVTATDAAGLPLGITVDSGDIAWSSDRKHLYGDVLAENFNTIPALRGGGELDGPLNQDQHWMVWQRPSAHPRTQKLYGRIDTDLEAGTTVTVAVSNRYNTYVWQGHKSIILTTNSWVGGYNLFLGSVYIAVGGVAWLAGIVLFLCYNLGLWYKRSYGDLGLLSWEQAYGKSGSSSAQPPLAGILQQGVHSRNRSGEHRVVPT